MFIGLNNNKNLKSSSQNIKKYFTGFINLYCPEYKNRKYSKYPSFDGGRLTGKVEKEINFKDLNFEWFRLTISLFCFSWGGF